MEYEYNLNDIYDIKDTDRLIREFNVKLDEFSLIKGELNSSLSNERFLEILGLRDWIFKQKEMFETFAYLYLSLDTADSDRVSYFSKINQVCVVAENRVLFFDKWFTSLDEGDANRLIEISSDLGYFLRKLQIMKKHTLSESEERIMNMRGSRSGWTNMYEIISSRFKYDWDGKKMNYMQILKFVQSQDREERLKADKLIIDSLKEYEGEIGHIFRTICLDVNSEVEIRGYDSPIGWKNLINGVSDKAVNNLLSCVRKNANLFARFFKLKTKMCGIENFDIYDLFVGFEKEEVGFEKAKEFVLSAYKEFHPKVYELALEIFDKDHIHTKDLPNKRKGYWSFWVNQDVTPYTIINYQPVFDNMFMLMHELGHCVHFLSVKHKKGLTYSTSQPVFETISLFFETVLAHYLMKDPKYKKQALVTILQNQFINIVNCARCAMFEIEGYRLMKEGGGVEGLNQLYLSLTRKLLDGISVPESMKYKWMAIPHLFMSPFYMYAYSFGNLMALILFNKYKKDPKVISEKVIEMMGCGGSKSPKELFEIVGIDIEDENVWDLGFEIVKEEIRSLASGSL